MRTAIPRFRQAESPHADKALRGFATQAGVRATLATVSSSPLNFNIRERS
jgi:hypothetical protein